MSKTKTQINRKKINCNSQHIRQCKLKLYQVISLKNHIGKDSEVTQYQFVGKFMGKLTILCISDEK